MNAFSSLGNGLDNGVNQGVGLYNALSQGPIQRRLMMAQAQKAEQEADPNGPMGQMERAKAQNYIREAGRPLPSQVDMGDFLPAMKGKGVRVDANQALPYLLMNAAKSGGVGGMNPNASGAPGGAIPLDAAGEKMVNDVAMEMGGLKNAYDTGVKGKVFGSNAGNLTSNALLGMHMDRIPGLGPLVQNANQPGKQYMTGAQDAMFRVAKVLSGGRPNQKMQEELQGQIPQIGSTDPEGQFNQLLNSAETRAQGLVDQYALTHGPEMAEAMKQRLGQVFGKFRIGQSGAGVTTNQDQGLTNGLQMNPRQSELSAKLKALRGK